MRVGLPLSLVTALGVLGCAESSSSPPAPPPPQVAGAGARPPNPPAAHAGDGPGAVFAITKVFAGDTDRDGARDHKNGWKQFGFNIDGFITTCSGNLCQEVEPHCAPNAGASQATAFPDGDDGIDNSFGQNIIPFFTFGQGKGPGPSVTLDAEIAHGDFTLLLAVDRLGAERDYNPLAARIYEGARLASPPKLDGTDVWPVARAWVDDPEDVRSAKFQFPKSWVTNNTWVSGEGDLNFFVLVSGQRLSLPLHHAIVTMDLSPSRASATGGVISGIVAVKPLVESIRKVFGGTDASLCDGNTISSISNQARQAADIMIDGRVGDASETCNGISVGFGFDAVKVQLGPVVADPAPPDPCGK